MSESIALNIETETENGEVISLCHINERSISLEISQVANVMFHRNRQLFDKINTTTKFTGGTLYRQEVVRSRESVNGVYVGIDNNYDFKEVEIGRLFFENNVIKKQHRAITQQGRKFDYDPEKVSDSKTDGFFNENKLSTDDIASAKIITTVQEIILFQDQGVKSVLIRDHLSDRRNLLEVGYRIVFSMEDSFKEYLDFVIKQAERAISFLDGYVNSLSYPSNYKLEEDKFHPDFSKRVLVDLGMSTDFSGEISLTSERIKNSDFGQAAIACYNLTSLMTSNVNKSELYSSVITGLLPTIKTTSQNISLFVNNFKKLLVNVKYLYLADSKESSKEKKYSRVSEGKILYNTIEAISKEKLSIETESLGYSVFSDESDGLNLFSSADYKKRWALEQAKYYPSIEIEDATAFLRPSEQSKLLDTSNAPAFLTPSSLVMGRKKISTARGMNNVNLDDVRQFRLAKSARAQLQNISKRPQSTRRGTVTKDTLSSFNITISAPKATLLSRSTEEELDPLIDSKHYVGTASSFTTNNPFQLLKLFKRKISKEDRRQLSIASDIVPRRFLMNDKSIRSIREIQFTNPKSVVRKLARTGELKFENIPPQIKFMMSKSFAPNPQSDPIKNRESSQIIDETIKNLFVIKGLTGFGKNSKGFIDVHQPIYVRVSPQIISSGRPLLTKAYNYELPELGIVKDNFLATIYNNLTYIRD